MLIRDAEHRGLSDRGMRCQYFLDLLRVDVHATGDDLVVLPIDKVEVALLVEATEVTRAEPAVEEGRLGFLRPIPIAGEQKW